MKKEKAVLLGVAAAAGAALGGAAVYLKKKNICPRCEIKKALSKTKIHYSKDSLYNNGTCAVPPMGWSSWNLFKNKIDENVILDIARAMKISGLADAGYVYVNLDDCWQSSMRDENGRLQGDLTTFPHGIKRLVDEVNAMGLKLGIYSSNGTFTCEDLPASLYHERTDAETFAEWGVEYFKYDFCHNVPLPSKAPFIDSILIGGAGISREEEYSAQNAVLTGEAKLVKENGGKSYIKGLCSGIGAAEFKGITVPEDGEYVLTIVMRKSDSKDKFCQVTVNKTDKYGILIPPTKAFSREGRLQLVVKLKKGENTVELTNPVGSAADSAAMQYEKMGAELKRATALYAEKNNCEEKPILFSICEWGKNRPWKWASKAGNIWRTTPDIMPHWASIIGIYEVNVRLNKYAGPGAFNDPDMLEVGNGDLTVQENMSHFSLWAMMAAPLILGNDIRSFVREDGTCDNDNKILNILKNEEIIAVDQDKLGIQCVRIKSNGVADVLVKPLADGSVALCFLNKGPVKVNVKCAVKDILNLASVRLPSAQSYNCRDLWEKTEQEISESVEAGVEPHGVRVFKLSAVK